MKQFLYLLMAVLLSFPARPQAQSNAPATIIFIVDASGSMWGKIGNSTKIQVAKETMQKLGDKIAANTKVGLIAYGHTKASDCNDIETLIPVGPVNKKDFAEKVNALNPKGKTPINLSVNHALQVMKGINGPVTVILVSDGLETCTGNACETVSKAKQQGINLTIHVVGFGIEEKDQSPLECIAQAGGGQYFPANNAGELALALDKTVEEPPAGGGFISVKTTLAGKPLDATVQVYRKGETQKETASGRTYTSAATNPRVLPLPPGNYDLVITPVTIAGQAPVKLTGLTVGSKDTLKKEVDFEQGIVEVLVQRNGELSDATITLFKAGTKIRVDGGRSYNRASHNPAIFKIPPGEYDIVIGSVELKGVEPVLFEKRKLAAGGNIQLSHNFISGELSIGAKKDGALIDASVTVYNQKTGESVIAGRTYTNDKSNPKMFTLPPGTYKVDVNPVRPAGLTKKTISLEVKANQKAEKIVEW